MQCKYNMVMRVYTFSLHCKELTHFKCGQCTLIRSFVLAYTFLKNIYSLHINGFETHLPQYSRLCCLALSLSLSLSLARTRNPAFFSFTHRLRLSHTDTGRNSFSSLSSPLYSSTWRSWIAADRFSNYKYLK